MPSLRQQFRLLFAILCSVAHLAALPQFSALMVGSFMSGGHELVLVPHKGHQDVLLHHDDDEGGAGTEDAVAHATQHDGHRNHHDHMLCVAQGDHLGAWSKLKINGFVAFTTALPPASLLFIAGWRMRESPLRARPPPAGNGVLTCLRTTVLLV